ncbi:DUF1905 domain-containing protein [uncultured Polaribacter sp.]|uniref:DUF1905 domain-containing protein n=1 Tax=uncultured Polaribacter sp. TaxID=174711 RepID=UPI00260A5287|nr:DUF1905 domain-containing protein [uncultured Polaribacter sp.]
MNGKVTYTFTAKMWQHNPPLGWYFVSLPKNISSEIRNLFKNQEEGWGRMKVSAIINDLKWDTAIWFDSKKEIYILPIKAAIRKKTNLKIKIDTEISILL